MKHVYGHQDKDLAYDQLGDLAQTNVDADGLASEDLVISVGADTFITGTLPFDDVGVRLGRHIVSGSPSRAI